MNIRISGAICGDMWMPQAKAGILGDWNITRERSRITSSNGDPILITDAVRLILNENGGDFRDAHFTADTEIIFEYRKPTADGYVYHCKSFPFEDCPSLADFTDAEAYVSDFCGECE